MKKNSGISKGIPFYRHQILFVCIAFTLLNMALVVWVSLQHGFQWLTLLFPFASAIFACFAWIRFKRPMDFLEKMELLLDRCGAMALGERFDIDVTQHDIPEDAADLWLTRWIPLLPTA